MSKSKILLLLLLTVIVFLSNTTYRGLNALEEPGGAPLQTPIVCEGCSQVAATPPPLPSPPAPLPAVATKWDLWTHGTLLRGANIWQRCLGKDDAPCASFETSYDDDDFKKLRAWGANYVNISYPGIFSEKKIRQNGRGPEAYRKVNKALTRLLDLIELCRRHDLFVVVSFRTGPGRNEAVFDNKEKNPLTTLWETEHGALTKKAVAAQDAWVEMWREAACALKDKANVVGYDLMVEPHQERELKDGVNKQEFWFALADRLARAVRCEDMRTPILIGGAKESGACSLSCVNPDRFDRYGRIVYTAHQYHPYDEYTHQPNKYAKYECVDGAPQNSAPGRRDAHVPRAFDESVEREMYRRYEYIYGFKVSHGAQVAVNEFGVVRYAGASDEARDAGKAITYETDLNERVGANHALWLWETRACISYDEMNLKHGVNPKNHADLTPEEETKDPLVTAVKTNWARNGIYATTALLEKLGAEVQPPRPHWLSCPPAKALPCDSPGSSP